MNCMSRTKKRIIVVAVAAFMFLVFVLILCSCQNRKDSISFDMPSKDNLPMPTGRSFYVSGMINTKRGIPSDAVFEIDMLDSNGKIIRHVLDSKPDSDHYYIYPEMTEKFCKDMDRIYDSMKSANLCEYLVSDPSEPNSSFRNAEIKCCLSDNKFKALIVGGTDEEHDAAVDDGCHFTDAQGKPYNALSPGEYVLKAMLKDKDGNVLLSAEHPINIGDPKAALVIRFHPEEYMDLMLSKMNEIAVDSKTNNDNIPGYIVGIDGNTGGHTMLFKANDMALYRNAHTYLQIYMIDPESSSWTVELPYLYYIDHIDVPDYFTSCYFDIGEPVLYVGKEKQEGKIVCFENGDHHAICRIDSVPKGTADNVFDIKASLQSTCTDFEKTEISVLSDSCFAVMGVLAPAKLKDSYVFNQYQDDIRITNRVETLDYTFTSDQSVIKYTKPVYLSRINVEEKDGDYDSLLEYYHVFDSNDFEAGKTYQVLVKGFDKNGEEVQGTEEHFSIRCK